ncbi:MAG TPA: ABC transporter ATP-binding protein, partial [Actinomycetota bacterium]|nr:ABC transporter ATP-binding protein [Actinomycetota bacterium]
MSLLEVKDLRSGYGSLQVLQGISFSIEEGETAVLLGLNGAGKTTTILSLAGLLKPWEGSVSFDGADVTGHDTRKLVSQGVVLVPEGRRIFPQLTVAQNLRLGAWPYRKDRKRTREIVEQSVEYFPRLRERWTQLGGTLSGGEQQMLTLCRTLLGNPELIMIDEPTEGLAPKIVELVGRYLQELKSRGISVLLIEQKLAI